MNALTSSPDDFLCPGQRHPISRSLHLARMAEFYPPCRNCEHRGDAGTLSAKLVKRLKEAWASGQESANFHEEGFGGTSLSDLTPSMTRQTAGAFGLWLQREKSIGDSLDVGAPGSCVPTPERGNECAGKEACRLAVACDARAIMPEYIAAACEGLRWAACEAFDLGPMTSAGMQFALSHFQFDGGILLGSTSQKPSAICMKVWGPGPRRMLGKSSFQPIEAILQNGLDRPARSYGPQHRLQAEKPYLAALAERFHGLRPLRFVVDSTSRPWGMYLEKLLQTTACRIIPCRVLPQEFSRQIAADNAHFGIRVSSDGENCMIFDEQGRQIERERLVDLLKTLDLGTSDVPTDALLTVAHFLQFLSRDDRPCSAVLDGTV